MKYCLSLFFAVCFLAFGQEFTTSIRPEKFEVGSVFTILFETEGKKNLKISKEMSTYFLRPNPAKNNPDTIPFEMIESFGDSVIQIQGKSYYQVLGKALCFDTGLFLYSPASIIKGKDTLRFDAAICRVDFTPNSEQMPIRDIEEVFAEIPEEPFDLIRFLTENWYWILGGLVLVGAGFYLLKKRRANSVGIDLSLTLKEKILTEFDDLCKRRLWEKENLEAHFIPVVDILRGYLGKEFGYQLQHKTSFEILFLLSKEGLKEGDKQELELFLEVGDLIKFAQSQLAAGGVEILNLRIRKFLIEFERK